MSHHEPRQPGPTFAFVYAFLLGFLLWALSPWLFGVREPWDTDPYVYGAVLASGGVVLAQISRRPFLTGYLGVWLGQLAAFLLPWHSVEWLPLGAVSTALGSLLLPVGAVLGWVFKKLRRRQS